MRKVFTGGACTAAVLAFSLAAFAQSGQTGQTGSQSQPRMQGDQPQMTLVGCVQRESDYRAAHSAGSGGAAGTGVGAGNEFVLVNATISPGAAAGAAAATGSATQTGATGTSGSTAMGEAYELTGSGEGEVATFVGRRVEITGHLKSGSDAAKAPGATGTGTGGTNIGGQDLNLKEFEVMSVKAAEGTCPTLTPKK